MCSDIFETSLVRIWRKSWTKPQNCDISYCSKKISSFKRLSKIFESIKYQIGDKIINSVRPVKIGINYGRKTVLSEFSEKANMLMNSF